MNETLNEDGLTFSERMLWRSLAIKYRGTIQTTRVYNARMGYPNLGKYRALERAGIIEIHSVENASTEDMLYAMSNITFTLKDKNNA